MYLSFIICFIILAVTIGLIYKNCRDKKGIDSIVFIVATSCFMQMFVFTVGIDLAEKMSPSSILNAFVVSKKALGGEVDFSYLDNDLYSGEMLSLFRIWIYILWFTAPVATGGVLVSTLTKINKLFKKKTIHAERVFIFTELTTQTAIIAKTAYKALADKKQDKSVIFIFQCDSYDKTDIDLSDIPVRIAEEKLDEIAIDLKKAESIEIWDFSFDKKVRTSRIFKLYDRLNELLKQKQTKCYISLNIFSNDKVSQARYNKLIEKNAVSSDNNGAALEKSRSNSVFLSSIYNQLAQAVLTKYPLYEYVPQNDDVMNVLIIGCGNFGSAFIGKLFSFGHFIKDARKIRIKAIVFDIDAVDIREKMLMSCPEFVKCLEAEDRLEFIDCDAMNGKFAKAVDKIRNVDYCVVSTSDDEKNICIAEQLQTVLFRHIIKENKLPRTSEPPESVLPPIIVRIKDKNKAEFFGYGDNESESNICLKAFGCDEDVFSYNTLTMNKSNKRALMLHIINCCGKYPKNVANKKCDEIIELLKNEERGFEGNYDVMGSNEEAVYLKYLVSGCTHPDREKMMSESAFDYRINADYYDKPENIGEFEMLVSLFHDRWRDFAMYNGFICPTEEEYAVYKEFNIKNNRSPHKFPEAKFNALLVPFDKLPEKSACDYVKVKLLSYIMSIDNENDL